MAVKMALGVPQPSTRWGGIDPLTQIVPARPSDNEEVGFYWIDPEHPLATDVGNVYGSPNLPRETLDNEHTYSAGDVIDVIGYLPDLGSHTTWIRGNGTAANPIWLTGRHSSPMAMIANAVYFDGSYLYNEKFDLSQGGEREALGFQPRVKDGSSLHHYMSRNNYGRGTNLESQSMSSFKVQGASGNRFSDIIFYNNDVADYGVWNQNAENDRHAFHPSAHCDWVWCINNTSTRMGGDGIQVGATFGNINDRPTYTFIGNNHFYQMGENTVDIKESLYTVVSSNDLHDCNGDVSVAGYGAVFVIHYENTDGLYVLNNKIYNGNIGIEVTNGTKDARIIGNTISNIHRKTGADATPESSYQKGYAISGREHVGLFIANNTFYENDRHINVQNKALDWEIYNNIFGERNDLEEWDIKGLNSECMLRTTVENNLFHSIYGFHSSWLTGEEFSLAAIPEFIDCIDGDPLLDLTETGDKFRIQAGSPAIDTGQSTQAIYDEYFAVFGEDISQSDQWEYLRDQGVGIDIGASEFGGVFAPVLPNAPKDILVDAGSSTLRWTLTSINEDNIKVYENGIEIADLPSGTDHLFHAGASTATHSYRVDTENATGISQGSAVTSDIMSVVQLPDTFTEDLNLTKSHLAVRPYEYSNDGLLTIGEPQYVGDKFGILSTDIEFTKDSAGVGNGFNYITNDSGSISGSVSGTGDCDIITAINSYDGVATGRLQVGSTYVDITCADGAFDKYKTTLGVTGTKEYTFTPITTNAKHAIGLVSLQQTNETWTDEAVWVDEDTWID